jgi:CTP synthase (UTP-ammonia lyase)
MKPKIAIIGEYFNNFEPHVSLNKSLDYLSEEYNFEYEWIDTKLVEREKDGLLKNYAGIWSAPGSPFKSFEGALYAITFARLTDIPHIGTCAGFQHAVIELARNVLGIANAHHEEYNTQSSRLFVSKLVCSLAGKTMDVYLKSGTIAHELYDLDETKENYYCNFGINPAFKQYLAHPEITVSGVDQDDEIRIIEIPSNKFFLITLFVPQTKSVPGSPHPLIKGFVDAVCTK